MFRYLCKSLVLILLLAGAASAQQTDLEQELRKELDELKNRIAHLESLLERLSEKSDAEKIKKVSSIPNIKNEKAPALNTPSTLPTNPDKYRKTAPRFDVLLQSRGDYFADAGKNSTFFLRKAELGIKGHIAEHVDFSIEFDPVRASDPLRRTYIRLSHIRWLHIKFGLEKSPIGLEELSSTAQLPFVDRSEVNDRFSAAEELGVHLESHWPNLLFQFSVTNGGRRLLRDNNDYKDITARIVWAPIPWFSLGGATLQGRAGSNEDDRIRYNGELKLGSNLYGFQIEFYRAKDVSVWSSAFYVSGYWALPMKSQLLTHLQPVIRYEHIDREDNDELEELRLLTLGLSFMLDEHRSKFQINFLKDLHTGTRKDELRAQYQVEF